MLGIKITGRREVVDKTRPLRPGLGEPGGRRKRSGGGRGRGIGEMGRGMELVVVLGRGGIEF